MLALTSPLRYTFHTGSRQSRVHIIGDFLWYFSVLH
nr:MAG TPA: hypothetical protein [Bacteriophage sp.]